MSSNNLARFRSMFICTRSSRRSPPPPATPDPKRLAGASANDKPSLTSFFPWNSTPASPSLCVLPWSSPRHLGLEIAEHTLLGPDDTEASSVRGSVCFSRRRLAPASVWISCCTRSPPCHAMPCHAMPCIQSRSEETLAFINHIHRALVKSDIYKMKKY